MTYQEWRADSQFKNNYFTELCSGSEAGSYLRLIDGVYHSTLGLRVIQKKKKDDLSIVVLDDLSIVVRLLRGLKRRHLLRSEVELDDLRPIVERLVGAHLQCKRNGLVFEADRLVYHSA